MEKKILKYVLDNVPGLNAVPMPVVSAIRYFAEQNGKLCLWAEFPIAAENQTAVRTFLIAWTGLVITDKSFYLHTAFSGPYVWHLYELK